MAGSVRGWGGLRGKGGACVAKRGHAWQRGGMCGKRGACMAKGAGGMHGEGGGHVWYARPL